MQPSLTNSWRAGNITSIEVNPLEVVEGEEEGFYPPEGRSTGGRQEGIF